MEFITRQKFSLRNVPYIGLYGLTVAIAEPNPEQLSLYARHMRQANMDVFEFNDLPQLVDAVVTAPPDAIVINPFDLEGNPLSIVAALVQIYPDIPVIAVGDPMRSDYVDAIMKAGVTAHLHPRLTKPKDILAALEKALF